MRSTGFINLPEWQNDLQKILIEIGRKELLQLPVLDRENVEQPWAALEPEDFFSAIQIGIYFEAGNTPRRMTSTVVTTDAEFAISRLREGLYSKTFFSAATGGTFAFLGMAGSKHLLGQTRKILVQNDSIANYILSCMETTGKDLSDATYESQWEGIAKKSPNLNIHGVVTRNRLVLQIAEIFGLFVEPEAIKTTGFSGMEIEDIKIAHEFGYSIRLLGLASVDNDCLSAVVEPCMIPSAYLLAQARADAEIIYLQTVDGLSHVYSGPGTSLYTHVRGVLNDIEICETRHENITLYDSSVRDFEDCFYLRFNILNTNDTLSQIFNIFSHAGVQITKIHQSDSVILHEITNSLSHNFVLITNPTYKKSIDDILTHISKEIKLATLCSCYRFIRRA